MYPGHVFVSTQCKAASIKLGSRFNFWISQPFPPNLEELVHFRAVSYSVALNLSASRLGKKYKLCETGILQPFALRQKYMGYFFGWQVCPLLQRWTGLFILCSCAGLRPVAGLAAEARGFLQVGRLAPVLRSRCVQAREDGEKVGQWGVIICCTCISAQLRVHGESSLSTTLLFSLGKAASGGIWVVWVGLSPCFPPSCCGSVSLPFLLLSLNWLAAVCRGCAWDVVSQWLRKTVPGNSRWVVICDCNWATIYRLFHWVKLFSKLCSWKSTASLAYNSPLFPSSRLWFAVVHFPLKSAFCR